MYVVNDVNTDQYNYKNSPSNNVTLFLVMGGSPSSQVPVHVIAMVSGVRFHCNMCVRNPLESGAQKSMIGQTEPGKTLDTAS